VIFIAEADLVFLPCEHVRSSLDLVERALYARVPSRRSFVIRAEHVLVWLSGNGELRIRLIASLSFGATSYEPFSYFQAPPIGYIVF